MSVKPAQSPIERSLFAAKALLTASSSGNLPEGLQKQRRNDLSGGLYGKPEAAAPSKQIILQPPPRKRAPAKRSKKPSSVAKSFFDDEAIDEDDEEDEIENDEEDEDDSWIVPPDAECSESDYSTDENERPLSRKERRARRLAASDDETERESEALSLSEEEEEEEELLADDGAELTLSEEEEEELAAEQDEYTLSRPRRDLIPLGFYTVAGGHSLRNIALAVTSVYLPHWGSAVSADEGGPDVCLVRALSENINGTSLRKGTPHPGVQGFRHWLQLRQHLLTLLRCLWLDDEARGVLDCFETYTLTDYFEIVWSETAVGRCPFSQLPARAMVTLFDGSANPPIAVKSFALRHRSHQGSARLFWKFLRLWFMPSALSCYLEEHITSTFDFALSDATRADIQGELMRHGDAILEYVRSFCEAGLLDLMKHFGIVESIDVNIDFESFQSQ